MVSSLYLRCIMIQFFQTYSQKGWAVTFHFDNIEFIPNFLYPICTIVCVLPALSHARAHVHLLLVVVGWVVGWWVRPCVRARVCERERVRESQRQIESESQRGIISEFPFLDFLKISPPFWGCQYSEGAAGKFRWIFVEFQVPLYISLRYFIWRD